MVLSFACFECGHVAEPQQFCAEANPTMATNANNNVNLFIFLFFYLWVID
jgi:hypothetical protein